MLVRLLLKDAEYRVRFTRHLQDLGLEVKERCFIPDVEPNGHGGAHLVKFHGLYRGCAVLGL